MDLVTSLALHLGLDEPQAKALAGSALGVVRAQVGPEAAAMMDSGIPELKGWLAQAGGQGLDAARAGVVAPLVYDFLQARMPPQWMAKAAAAAPLLAGGPSAPGANDALGELGKLLR